MKLLSTVALICALPQGAQADYYKKPEKAFKKDGQPTGNCAGRDTDCVALSERAADDGVSERWNVVKYVEDSETKVREVISIEAGAPKRPCGCCEGGKQVTAKSMWDAEALSQNTEFKSTLLAEKRLVLSSVAGVVH